MEWLAIFPLFNSKERSYLINYSLLEYFVFHFSPFSPIFCSFIII